MNIAYIRVSTEQQNEERQREALKNIKIDKFFMDKMSGKNIERPNFKNMIEFVRDGDVVYISELSRLSRDMRDLLNTIEVLENKGVKLISCKENIDTSTATGRCFIGMIAVFNQFEREIINERVMAGVAIAKAQGKYKGRSCKKYDADLLDEVLKGLADKSLTVTKAAELLGVTRATVYNLLKRNGGVDNE